VLFSTDGIGIWYGHPSQNGGPTIPHGYIMDISYIQLFTTVHVAHSHYRVPQNINRADTLAGSFLFLTVETAGSVFNVVSTCACLVNKL
jgi:hypothetical protein